jgi:hypothetical protein
LALIISTFLSNELYFKALVKFFQLQKWPGNDLFSRPLARQLSSALARFTDLFGMAHFAEAKRGEEWFQTAQITKPFLKFKIF